MVRTGMFAIRGDGFVDFDPVVRFVNADCAGWLVVEAGMTPRSRLRENMAQACGSIQAKFRG
jgi:inosose dehydratase